MDKSIIIIGAGIAGLSAGCYGQMNGYRTQIFEMHNLPGGLCTSWKRKGYTFNGSIHFLVGSGPGQAYHRMWEELGALPGQGIVDHEEFTRVEGPDGQVFVVYTDIDRLEQHLKELSPADADLIEEFAAGVRAISRLDLWVDKPPALMGWGDGLRMAVTMWPFLRIWRQYGQVSLQDFATRFRDPFLRQAFRFICDRPDWPMPDCPLAAVFMTPMSFLQNHNAGYPIGGSLAFAQAIARRYLDLSGEIHYKAQVEKILVENDKAVGVRLADGTEHRADIIISAADGHATIFDMLEGRYLSDEIRRYYDELPIFQPLIQVSLGVTRDFSAEPPSIVYALDPPATIAGEERPWFAMAHYCYDPTAAPAGRSALVVRLATTYDYWKALRAERQRYEAEKEQVGALVIAQLDRRFPGLAGQVEVVDVATPLTTERYTANWQGSPEGWLPTVQTMAWTMRKGMPKTLPGLENFYMAGQWVEPGGGVPTVAQSGRNLMQIICKRDRKRFVTAIP